MKEVLAFTVIGGVTVWCAYLCVRAQRRENRAEKLRVAAAAAQRADGRGVHSAYQRCSSCGGEATDRVVINDQFVCKNRELCRETVAYETLLGQV
jgi:hypothetical protein